MLILQKKALIIFVLSTYMLLSMYIGTSSVYLPLYVPVSIFAIFLLFIIKPVYFNPDNKDELRLEYDDRNRTDTLLINANKIKKQKGYVNVEN